MTRSEMIEQTNAYIESLKSTEGEFKYLKYKLHCDILKFIFFADYFLQHNEKGQALDTNDNPTPEDLVIQQALSDALQILQGVDITKLEENIDNIKSYNLFDNFSRNEGIMSKDVLNNIVAPQIIGMNSEVYEKLPGTIKDATQLLEQQVDKVDIFGETLESFMASVPDGKYTQVLSIIFAIGIVDPIRDIILNPIEEEREILYLFTLLGGEHSTERLYKAIAQVPGYSINKKFDFEGEQLTFFEMALMAVDRGNIIHTSFVEFYNEEQRINGVINRDYLANLREFCLERDMQRGFEGVCAVMHDNQNITADDMAEPFNICIERGWFECARKINSHYGLKNAENFEISEELVQKLITANETELLDELIAVKHAVADDVFTTKYQYNDKELSFASYAIDHLGINTNTSLFTNNEVFRKEVIDVIKQRQAKTRAYNIYFGVSTALLAISTAGLAASAVLFGATIAVPLLVSGLCVLPFLVNFVCSAVSSYKDFKINASNDVMAELSTMVEQGQQAQQAGAGLGLGV